MYQTSWSGTDFYQTLGVSRDADEVTIKKAYRAKARKLHPDTNSAPNAEEQFKKVAEAYSVLSDESKRKSYDSGQVFGGFGDSTFDYSGLFDDMGNFSSSPKSSGTEDIDELLARLNDFSFGSSKDKSPSTENGSQGGSRFRDIFDSAKTSLKDRVGLADEATVEVTFEEAAEGTVKEATFKDGTTKRVTLPAGVKDGDKIRVQNDSKVAKVSVKPHKRFSRTNDDLVVSLPISLRTAIQGGVQRLTLPTAGSVAFRLPKNCANRTLKLAGKGFGGGDALIQPFIELPDTLNEEQIKVADLF